MENIWLMAVLLFLILTFLFWKLTREHFKKEYGPKKWEKWGTRIFYWQGVIFVGTGGTFLILYILNWTNILTF